jgi:hypothetical protein
MRAPLEEFVASMESPLPPPSHGANEEEAKDGDEIDDE